MTSKKTLVQGNLVEKVCSTTIKSTINRKPIEINELSDQELIELLFKANLTNVESFAEEILARGIGDLAIVSLGKLWERFRGHDLKYPKEQVVVLKTLGQIDQNATRDLLLRIMSSGSCPESLLPLLLESAIKVRVKTSQQQLIGWLKHKNSEIRLLACSLMKFGVNLTLDVFKLGLADHSNRVRRETLISMGLCGYEEAKSGLLSELESNPTSHVIYALESIIDEDIITHLGRRAESSPDLVGVIIDVLQLSEIPRAKAVVKRLSKPG